ncbi:MAG TPA: hypothetical protein VIK65_08960 [Candidatus Limnocylindrales bacterium]
MTTVISVLGILGRAIGRLLTSSLGWGTSLLYGRVPTRHQRYVEAMFGGSVLWAALVLITFVPPVAAFVFSTTPFVPSVGRNVLRTTIIAALILLPALVGLAGALVPTDDRRPHGLAILGHIARGYPLAILLAGLALFLPLAGAARRIGSLRRGWADVDIPIIVKPGGYERMVEHVRTTLRGEGFELSRHDAPAILELPGRLLELIAGRDVGDLVPDRMIELRGRELEVGVYPSDIVISGATGDRLRARAALMTALLESPVHFTTSAESQKVEDKIGVIVRPSTPRLDALAEVDALDRELARLDVPSRDWDIVFRLRLQAERDLLRRT